MLLRGRIGNADMQMEILMMGTSPAQRFKWKITQRVDQGLFPVEIVLVENKPRYQTYEMG